jgi:hypothetical protein
MKLSANTPTIKPKAEAFLFYRFMGLKSERSLPAIDLIFGVEANSPSKLEKNLVQMAVVGFSRGLSWFRSWLSGWFSARASIPARCVCGRTLLEDELVGAAAEAIQGVLAQQRFFKDRSRS